jgi:hypothetical protein
MSYKCGRARPITQSISPSPRKPRLLADEHFDICGKGKNIMILCSLHKWIGGTPVGTECSA